VGKKGKGFTHEAASSDVEWYTPPSIFEVLGLEYDVDPCHPVCGLPWIPATWKYTIEDDGLSIPWFGRIWMNMPYDNPELWMRLMARACTGFDVDSGEAYDPAARWAELGVEPPAARFPAGGIAISYVRTDADWFQRYGSTCDALLLLKKRVKFCDASGAPRQSLRRLTGRKLPPDAPVLDAAVLAQVPYLGEPPHGYEWTVSAGGAGSMLMGWGADCVEAMLAAEAQLGTVYLHSRWG
jgi:hypothetical protein